MRAERAGEDLSSAIWQAGLEETARIERKAKRPKLLQRPKSRKRCEEKTQGRIDGLLRGPATRATAAELSLIRRGCIACGRCPLD